VQEQLLQRIYERAVAANGCWDVFSWRGGEHLFAEFKGHGHDRIPDSQRRWLQAALECGLPLTSFLIVEWSVRGAPRMSAGLQTGVNCDLTGKTR